jgi:hypothetical protein
MVSGPADNHLVRIGVADLAGGDMTIIPWAHSSLTAGGKPPNTSRRLSDQFVIVLATAIGKSPGMALFRKKVPPEHSPVV